MKREVVVFFVLLPVVFVCSVVSSVGALRGKADAGMIESTLKRKSFSSDIAYLKSVELAPPALDASDEASRESFIDWMRDVALCDGDRIRTCRAALGVAKEGMLDMIGKDVSGFQFDLATKNSAQLFINAGEIEYPEAVAKECIDDAGWRFPTGTDGDALHDGHQLAGMVAVKQGKLKEANEHLIQSLDSFSPVTSSFGPRMHLAKLLIEKGEFDAVRAYFLRCKEGWSFAKESGIDGWIAAVDRKQMPTDDNWVRQLGYL